MAVVTYSLKADGNKYLSTNIKVREFACKDGTDKILIDSNLVAKLQTIRDFFGKGIIISSGYRTVNYNSLIGGATNSYHCKGMAADFDIGIEPSNIDPRLVAMYADTLLFGGIGRYIYADGRSWIHCDTGIKGKYWIATAPHRAYTYIDTFLPTLKKQLQFIIIPNKYETEILQTMLKRLGFYFGLIDGRFGSWTRVSVIRFQQAHGLLADGIVGRSTWIKLFSQIGKW